MARTRCGFDSGPAGNGRDLLVRFGPTLSVLIGFDSNYDPAAPKAPPVLPRPPLRALVDSGAFASCIDSTLAMQLNLPIVDRQIIAGVGGNHEVNMHLAHVHIPSLNFTIYGPFAGVNLIAGGQAHYALIGRTFLQSFTMIYEGRTGSVHLSNEPETASPTQPAAPASTPKLASDRVESFAIRCAKGNNGGEWATHYTEDQKNFWRDFVRDLAADLGADINQS
jgi:hypothetical protein